VIKGGDYMAFKGEGMPDCSSAVSQENSRNALSSGPQ